MPTHTHAHGAHAHGHDHAAHVHPAPTVQRTEAVSWLMRSVSYRLLGALGLCAGLGAALVWALSAQG